MRNFRNTPKAEWNGVELDGKKLPRGRHDAPINRPCRTRKTTQRFKATQRLEPDCDLEQTCGKDKLFVESPPSSGVA